MKRPTTQSDPSTYFGGLGALFGGVFSALVAFDVIDFQQAEALLAIVTGVLPIVVAYGIRHFAWAPETVDALIQGFKDETDAEVDV